MKKSAIALLVASATSYAGTIGPATSAPTHNFFIGGTAGLASIDSTHRLNMPGSGGHDTISLSSGTHTFLGGGLLGIQQYFENDLYAALALNALYNSYNNSIFQVSRVGDATLKNNFQYGAAVRLGKKLENNPITITPYLLAGVEAGQFTLNTNITAGETLATKDSHTLTGFQGGIGALFSVNPNMTLGIEYAYNWFGSLNANLYNNEATSNTKVQQGQILVSLNYLF